MEFNQGLNLFIDLYVYIIRLHKIQFINLLKT